MGKKFVQFAAFCMALAMLLAVSASAAPAKYDDLVIRVGLYYGSDALPGANLQNYVGSGYLFGFMEDDEFVEVGYTPESAISMVKAQNVYYSASAPEGGYGYSDQITSSIAVGCYHLCLNESFDSFEDALETADELGGFPAWIDGEYQVRIGAFTTKEEAQRAAQRYHDVYVAGTSSYGITVVVTGTDQPVFQYDCPRYYPAALVVRPGLDDEEKAVTYFKGYKYYGDFQYERIDGDNLTVVGLVDLEDYIRGIVPYEMSNTWPLEALKAQAVVARSYTVTNLNRHSDYHFDICNTTCCQVYLGVNRANELTDQAVDETEGEFAWYDGEVIQAFYHSSDGGATENSENVWRAELPYLRGVEDPYEALIENQIPLYHYTKTYTGKQLQQRLQARGVDCAEIVDVQITQTTPTGNVYSVTLTDANGEAFTFSKDNARIYLGTSSLRFSLAGSGDGIELTGGESLDRFSGSWIINGDGELERVRTENVYAVTGDGVEAIEPDFTGSTDGVFVFEGTGSGHNVGMSQWGAYAMAMEGYTYEEILKFYYTGVEIY